MMSADYDVLVDIYDRVDLGLVGSRLTPNLINFAQREGWMGRRTLDLGCGNGTSLDYLAQHGYIVTGIDQHAGMLDLARRRYEEASMNATWKQADIRALDQSSSPYDLVTAVNVLSELDSLREVEQVMHGAHLVLKEKQWFIFDLLTIEGLHARSIPHQEVLQDTSDWFIVADNSYDFERTLQKRRYVIFKRESDRWVQRIGERVLRAYPTQAVVSLTKRAGFDVLHVLTTDFTVYDPQKSHTHRVIIIAQKS